MSAITVYNFIGADFHRAMVATAPGKKLLIGRRPMKNRPRLQFFPVCKLINGVGKLTGDGSTDFKCLRKLEHWSKIR